MKRSEARALIESKVTINENGCWIWPQNGRYGVLVIEGKRYSAHRLAYMVYHGRIGDKEVCHSCDVTLCVNPEHLFIGTHMDNMGDMVSKDRTGTRELNNRQGKLTDEQVREIRARHARGVPCSWIADDYGMTTNYIRDIVTKRIKGNHPTRHYADTTA